MAKKSGGGRGIRTLDTVPRIHAFQACAFSHSATPPAEECLAQFSPAWNHGDAENILRPNNAEAFDLPENISCSEPGGSLGLVANVDPTTGTGVVLIVCRILGWILVLLALGAAAYEIMVAINGPGGWRMIALGELWFKLHPHSLNAFQAGIQRYLTPWLWEPVITTILLWPGWLVFGVPGLLAVILCRRRRRYGAMGKRRR